MATNKGFMKIYNVSPKATSQTQINKAAWAAEHPDAYCKCEVCGATKATFYRVNSLERPPRYRCSKCLDATVE